MDLDGFRQAQSPWFFTQPAQYIVDVNATRVVVPRKDTQPTPDARFAGWAAPMNDGRIATDYRSRCALNLPTGTQYATRQFMQHNGSSLIAQSRQRQAERAGAGMAYDSSTEMPFRLIQICNEQECGYARGEPQGVGVTRQESVPSLFGTFAPSKPSWLKPAAPRGTVFSEGGRNSVRGQF
jgi:hypothetical protein